MTWRSAGVRRYGGLLLCWLLAVAVWHTPVRAEAVRIAGPSGPLEAEALRVPGADHAVLIVPGSGPIDRDGNMPTLGYGTDTYRLLAEGLAEHGVGSLRIDKRGLFGSRAAVADPNAVTVAAYADDVVRWIGEAAALAPCVWLAGHSEGGLVALVAAVRASPEPLCGLILLATPGRPVGRLLIEQIAANPANTSILAQAEGIVRDLEAGRARDPGSIDPALRTLFPPQVQGYLTDLFGYHPAEVAARWAGPMLVVQGDRDLQVKPADAALLVEAAPQAVHLPLPGATHMLKPDRPGAPLVSYTDPSIPLHPDLLPGILRFLQRDARRD